MGKLRQIAGAVIGGIIGFLAGGTLQGAVKGALYGYSLGSMFETTQLDDAEGPRLDDLRAQVSRYGEGINDHHGHNELAGCVIWLKNNEITETEHRETVKSGRSKQTVIRYTYSATLAIAVADGPCGGISKIFADNILVYSAASGSAVTLAESSIKAQDFDFFLSGSGNEISTEILNDRGVNCPAFRNVSYVVIKNFELEKFGNRIPNFRFVVYDAESATSSDAKTLREIVSTANSFQTSVIENSGTGGGIRSTHVSLYDGGSLRVYRIRTNQLIYVASTTKLLSYTNIPRFTVQEYDADDLTTLISERGISYPFNPEFFPIFAQNFIPAQFRLWSVSNSSFFVLWSLDSNGNQRIHILTAPDPNAAKTEIDLSTFSPSGSFVNANPYLIYYKDDVLMVNGTGGIARIVLTNVPGDYSGHTGARTLAEVITATAPGSALFDSVGANYDSGRIFAMSSSTDELCEINPSTMVVIATYSLPVKPAAGEFAVTHNGNIIHYAGSTSGKVETIDITTGSLVHVASKTLTVNVPAPWSVTYYSQYVFLIRTHVTYSVGGTPPAMVLSTGPYLDSTTIGADKNKKVKQTISDVLSKIPSLRFEDVDLSGIADESIGGYTYPDRATCVTKLRGLMKAYQLDVICEDYKIKVFSRVNSSNVATLTTDDIQAHEIGSAVPDQDVIELRSEQSIPGEVVVNYLDSDRDFEDSIQTATRPSISNNVYEINIGMALTANKAKQIAEIALSDAVQEGKGTHTIRTSFKYSHLERGDLIDIETDDGNYSNLRIIDKELGKPGIVILKAVYSDLSNYTNDAAGETGQSVNSTLVPIANTILHVIDTVPLRDSDSDLGFYYGVYPNNLSARWGGAEVSSSRDFTRWTPISSHFDGLNHGSSTNALSASSLVGTWDESQTLNVSMVNGTLSTATETEVRTGLVNTMLYGSPGRIEIIKFVNATLEGDGTYTISKLLRGYWGTDHHMSKHVAGDVCVLLDYDNINRYFITSNDDYGTSVFVKATSFDRVFYKEDFTSIEITGESRKPRPVTNLKSYRNASGDVTFKWSRQSLINRAWTESKWLNIDTYHFEIDILNGVDGAVLRTLTTSGTINPFTVTYTTAQQVADFGSNQSNIYIDIYETDSVLGRGHIKQGLGI